MTLGSESRSAQRVTVIGGVVLTAALLLNFALGPLGLADGIDDPTASQYYLSNVPLLLGWGLLFGAAVLYAREWHKRSLLGRVAVGWTVLGFGVITVGFVAVVLAQLLGGRPVSDIGNMMAGMGMTLGAAPGSILFGVATLREGTPARASAALLAVSGLSLIGALFTQGMVPELVGMAMFILLPVAWLVYGLRRSSPVA